jgi:hypothetical protein
MMRPWSRAGLALDGAPPASDHLSPPSSTSSPCEVWGPVGCQGRDRSAHFDRFCTHPTNQILSASTTHFKIGVLAGESEMEVIHEKVCGACATDYTRGRPDLLFCASCPAVNHPECCGYGEESCPLACLLARTITTESQRLVQCRQQVQKVVPSVQNFLKTETVHSLSGIPSCPAYLQPTRTRLATNGAAGPAPLSRASILCASTTQPLR